MAAAKWAIVPKMLASVMSERPWRVGTATRLTLFEFDGGGDGGVAEQAGRDVEAGDDAAEAVSEGDAGAGEDR